MSAVVATANKKSTNGDGFTTDAINTSGANLITICTTYYGLLTAVSVSDSKSNTWTPLTAYNKSLEATTRIFYCENPSVGSGHTFTITGTATYGCAFVVAFSGATGSPMYDSQENGNNGETVTSLTTGSVTPDVDNAIIVTSLCRRNGTGANAANIDSSFTISGQFDGTGFENIPGDAAYYFQPTAGAVNPTWSWSGSDNCVAAIAVFKGTAGGGGGTRPVKMAGEWGGYAGDSGGFAG